MKNFTDDEMNALLPTAKAYSVVILKQGPNFTDDTAPAVIWEHGRRNFGLRHDGVLAVVFAGYRWLRCLRCRGVQRECR